MVTQGAYAAGKTVFSKCPVEREVESLSDEQVPEAIVKNTQEIATNVERLSSLTVTAAYLRLDNQMMDSAQRSLENYSAHLYLKQKLLQNRMTTIENL